MRSKSLLLCVAALSFLSLKPATKTTKASSPKEALQLRRIAEYWKEGDFRAAKAQILDLLQRFPETAAQDQLYTMLGDLYFFESAYQDAAGAYGKIHDKDLKKKVALNYMRSLFALSKFSEVIDEATIELSEKGGERSEIHFLLAESLWRHAVSLQDEEKKTALIGKAKNEYENLLSTKFKDSCLLPLAYIHRELKEYAKAVMLFQELVQKHPEKKEDFLFQVGCLQMSAQLKDEACATFGQIHKLGGKKAQAAAYNQLLLLFQMEKHEEFVSAAKDALVHIPKEKKALMQLYLGRSLFTLKNYKEAISCLQAFVAEKKENSVECKNALLCLATCAKETQDCSLMEQVSSHFEELFSQDLDFSKVLVLHAKLQEAKEDSLAAGQTMKKLLTFFPQHEEKEAFLYESARLSLKTKNWEESRLTFQKFISMYPASKKIKTAWHNLLHAALNERKQAHDSERAGKDTLLASLLEEGLKIQDLWDVAEKEQFHFLYGKTLYALGKWEECTKIFKDFVAQHPGTQVSSDAHLMLSFALHRAGKEDAEFTSCAEQTLSFDIEQEQRSLLHLMLYNAYLKQSSHNKALLEKAADHLYECACENQTEVKRDNLLWLANYYYARSKEEKEPRFATRAAVLFEKITKQLKAVSLETVDLEPEALKYADLLCAQEKHQEALALLRDMKALYETRGDLPWKFQRRALLELGRVYAQVKDTENALATYDFLITTAEHAQSAAADAALLERARLEYSLLKKEEKIDTNPRLSSILAALKDLQIKRKLHSEPVHLEAALEYAQIKSELAPQENRIERVIALLKNLKEEFLNNEDPDSQEYQACRLRSQEKDELFQTYMKFIDALLLQAQAELLENPDEKEALKTKAAALMEELKTSALTPYLRAKLEESKPL